MLNGFHLMWRRGADGKIGNTKDLLQAFDQTFLRNIGGQRDQHTPGLALHGSVPIITQRLDNIVGQLSQKGRAILAFQADLAQMHNNVLFGCRHSPHTTDESRDKCIDTIIKVSYGMLRDLSTCVPKQL